MNKFLLGTIVSVFLILSTEVIYADDEEDPADLGSFDAYGTPIVGFGSPSGAGIIMDGGGSGSAGEGGGGGAGDDASAEKEEYCDQVDEFTEFLEGLFTGSATPITGTAASGYSIAQGTYDAFRIIIDAAYRDIFYYARDGGVHPPGGYISVIDWQAASISWDLSRYEDFGAQHVFATWLKSVGLGNGTSVLTDPDPSTEC